MKIKYISFSLIILFIFTYSLFSDDFQYLGTYDLIKEFYFPRDEGTINEEKLIEYIENFCKEHDLFLTKTKINDEDNIITNSYNLEITIKGTNKGKNIIIAHLNSQIINHQYIDNSLSILIILELIKKCKNLRLEKDLVFLISGSNKNEKKQYNGINYFIKNNNLDHSLVTAIDLLSNKSRIKFSGNKKKKVI